MPELSTLLDMVIFNASDKTGSTDVTSELQSTIDGASGKSVFILAGTYLINNLAPVLSNTRLVAIGDTVTFITSAGNRCIFHGSTTQDFDQNVSAVVNALNPVGEYKSRLTVSDASAFSVGDKIMVTSDDDIGSQNWNIGECCTVFDLDTVSEYLYIDRRLALESFYSTTIKVVKIPSGQFELNGINFSADGDPFDTSITDRQSTVELRGIPNVTVKNCVFNSIWEDALNIWTTHTGHIKNCEFKNLPNLENDDTNLVTGYGVNIFAGCTDIVVESCLGEKLRHMITTGAQTFATFNVNNWEFQGINTYCTFKNLVARNTYAASFDFHEGSRYHSMIDLVSVNPKEGLNSKDSDGTGVSIRSMDSKVVNYTQTGGKNGIVYLGSDFGTNKVVHVVNGATITGLDVDNNSTGIYVSNAEGSTSGTGTDLTESPRVVVSNCYISGALRGVYMQPFSDLTIDNSTITDTRNAFDIGFGSFLSFEDLTVDYFNNGYQFQNSGVFLQRGSAGETSNIFGGKLNVKIDQNSANNPDFILKANDSNGVKKYDIGEVRVINVNSEVETSYPDLTDGNVSWQRSTAVKTIKNSNYKTVSATYTMHSKDDVVEATANTFTITLPPDPYSGQEQTVSNSGAGIITLSGGSNTINGSATDTIAMGGSISIVFNGSEWRITSEV